MRFLLAMTLAVAAASGCVATGRAAADDALLAATVFAPEAEVSLSAMTLHPRGFYYRDLQGGSGPSPTAGSAVQVSYIVRLPDGRVVDAATPDRPMRFAVGERAVIVALDDAVREMRVGGTRQLVIPPRLGYGARGAGPVPGNTVIVMLVRLERVE